MKFVFLFVSLLSAVPLMADVETTPLAPRSRAEGTTLFTRLPPERTGIVVTNDYADPAMWAEHYRELIFGGMGTGVAIGDYDNDGRPDVFVASKTEASRLFRNLGNWRFEDVTEAAGLLAPSGMWQQGLAWARRLTGDEVPQRDEVANWKQGVVFVDVNNDGWLDLHVCRFGAPNQLFINQGDGTFTEEAQARGLAIADGSGTAAFCDYDGDGWLDVYLQTNMLDVAAHPNGQPDRLLRNRGDGFFVDVTARAGIGGETSGHSVAWWDENGDGRPDLYVANDFAVPDSLYRNNGDGTFTEVIDQVVSRSPYYSMGSDQGDADGDGDLDLLVADMAASTHERDQRGMSGSRARGQVHPDEAGTTAQTMRNALYLNTGTARVQEAAFLVGLAATDWTWSVLWADFDNDGWLDLHVTNGMIREYHNSDFLERIMISEDPAEPVRIMKASPVMAEENLAFRNHGGLEFEAVGPAWGLDEKGVSFGAALGDLDGDGDLDLVYGNYERGPTVLRNDSTEGHQLVVALRGTRSNRFGLDAVVRVETAARQQVRVLRATRGYLSGSEPIAHFGLGEATTVTRLVVEWPSGRRQVIENVAADQRVVITESADSEQAPAAVADAATWFESLDSATGLIVSTAERPGDEELMRPLQPRRFGHAGPDASVGDFNGDGLKDVVVASTGADPARLLLAEVSGRYSALALPPLEGAAEEGPLAAADVDGDGDFDLLRTRGGARLPAGAAGYQPELWLNDGFGHFARSSAALPAAPISVGALVVADFDRDGRPDVYLGSRGVVGAYPAAESGRWWRGQGSGRFADVTSEWAPSEAAALVTAAVPTDLDGDGWVDLVVASEWGPVRYWHNRQGRGFEDRTAAVGFEAAGTGWWRAVAVGDLNGDGRPDLALGNAGLNTQYHASAEAPAVLLDGDFGGRTDTLVEAHWIDGRLVPWRNRKDMTAQVRDLARRYRRNADYALATVDDLFGAEQVTAARRLEATELRSGVLLSQPDGRYVFSALPRIAQISSMEDVLIWDVDGDGAQDLVAVHNDHQPIGLVGWFEGGLGQILRGDGQGDFTAVPPAESGWVVPGDAQRVRLLHAPDGAVVLLVTRNDQTTLAFRRR